MKLTEEMKIANFEYTVYNLEESLKCELEELKDDWLTNLSSAYQRGKLNSMKETLGFLTSNEIWQLPLEELKEKLG